MRIRFTKDYKGHKTGDIIEVSRNEAFGLIDSGVAIVSKELTKRDYKVQPVKIRTTKRGNAA